MRRTLRIALATLSAACFSAALAASDPPAKPSRKEARERERATRRADDEARREKGEVETTDALAARRQYFLDLRRGPDGRIPWNARNDAIRTRDRNILSGLLVTPHGRAAGADSIPGDTWVPLGPAPIDIGGMTWGGRATSIAIDPTNDNIVYIGGAQGGVWKTTNGGATWTPLTDKQPSLATGSIAIDPANPNTVYVGTGEASGSCDSYFGAGILKSTDGGANWTLLGAAEFESTSVSRIVVDRTDSNRLWAANVSGAVGFVSSSCYGTPATVSYGVWRSLDAGATWTRVLGPSQTGGSAETTDIFQMPGAPATLWAGVVGSGLWKSTDFGATWTKITISGMSSSLVGRVDFGWNLASTQTIYMAVERSNTGGVYGNWRTTNAGANWTTTNVPSSPCSNYCWYCLTVDMAADGTVILGGVPIYRSSNQGGGWTDITNSNVHVDQHQFVYASNGTLWAANDGGIFTSTNNGSSWTSRNAGLGLNQFYAGASLHPTNPAIAMGGLQDNGTVRTTGTQTWSFLFGGDGAYTAIDFQNPDTTWYVSYQGLNISKTTNGGGSYNGATSGINFSGAPFIATYVMCPSNPLVLLAGTDNVWRTANGANLWATNSPDPLIGASGSISAISFAASDTTCSTYFAGTNGGGVAVTTTGGGTSGWNTITTNLASGGRAVTDVAVDPANPNIVYVSLSGFGGGHVFKTTNALDPSPVWAQIDAGIPNIPCMALLIDPTDSNTVYLGTDIGMFRSTDAGATWGPFDNGLPNVAIYDIVGNPATNSVVAFTHGRSAWRLTSGGAPPPPSEASAAGTMLASEGTGTSVNLNYTPSCDATDHAVFWGTGPIGGAVSWTNAACLLGSSGAASFDPGTPVPGTFVYFVVVGQTGALEGSYGRNSAGAERPEATFAAVCNRPQTLGGACP